MSGKFTGIEACVFDAYGTLFDVTKSTEAFRARLGDLTERLADIWRQKQVQYTWLRSLMGRYADFWHVTGDALSFAMKSLGLDDPALRSRLMEGYLSLAAYPEVKATLARLKAANLKTAILSNGSPMMLTAAATSAGIVRDLDALLSVEAVDIYKPHPSVYKLATDRFGVEPQQICFLSSNGWDAAGAAAFGFRVAWVNRGRQPQEVLPAHPEVEIASLAELPALLGL